MMVVYLAEYRITRWQGSGFCLVEAAHPFEAASRFYRDHPFRALLTLTPIEVKETP